MSSAVFYTTVTTEGKKIFYFEDYTGKKMQGKFEDANQMYKSIVRDQQQSESQLRFFFFLLRLLLRLKTA